MAQTSLTASLLNLVNVNNGLASLFSTSASFANPIALAAAAQATLDFTNQFPSEQALALSGLFMQLSALQTAAAPLAPSPLSGIPGLKASNSPLIPTPYTQTSATSSNTAAVTVSSTAGATITGYKVGVSQLGAAQVDTSSTLSSTGTAFTAGNGAIEINVPGVTGGSNAQAFANANYTITAGETNQNALTAIAGAINAVSANNAIQTVAVSGASSGQFELSFKGATTAGINFNATAAQVQTALQNAINTLPGATGNDVTVSQNSDGSYVVGFHGVLDNQPLPVLSAINTTLSGGASVSTAAYSGLSATVTTAGGNSTLSVSASAPGTNNSFTLTDTANTGIAVAFGVASVGPTGTGVSTAAADTVYSVDGASFDLGSGNAATIDSGHVTLTFSATTSSPATVTVSSNTSGVAGTSSSTGAVTNLATAYNNLQSYLSTNSLFINSNLAQQAENIITSNAAALASVGITGNASLAINQTTLAGAGATTLAAVFSGPNGVATQLAALAGNVVTSLAQNFAATAQPPANSAEFANGLASQFESLLLAGQAGSLLNVHA
jgi:hypothetical protein